MEKKIQDYLHLYIGKEVRHPGLKNTVVMTGRLYQSWIEKRIRVRPLLRPLSSMTEEEKKEVDRLQMKLSTCAWKQGCANVTHYLLSLGFDLFDLIPSGLAIDKTLHPSTIS